MKITFISDYRDMTYEHYLKQRKRMIDWVLNKKIHINPELLKSFKNISHPLIRKDNCMFPQKKIKISYKSFQIFLSK